MKTKIYRHGEVGFVKISKLPTGLKEAKTTEIVRGSHGNSHTFKGGKIYFKNVNDFIFGYFKSKDTKLYHPEHGKGKGNLKVAKLPNGIYELRKQHEYLPEGFKPVQD